MLLLTEDSFQDWALESIKVLTRTILRVNEEFLDTKILLHASVYNIANRGRTDTYTVPAPWRVVPCYYNLPFEFVQETQIPHMALADGDSSVENIRDKFTNNIRRMLGRFPFRTSCCQPPGYLPTYLTKGTTFPLTSMQILILKTMLRRSRKPSSPCRRQRFHRAAMSIPGSRTTMSLGL